ncbi:MAG TPA: hypothetical protein VI776_01340 [Anaerolineales bacterium]|nr:hypothetical protein [Anaerolineales bacterium]
MADLPVFLIPKDRIPPPACRLVVLVPGERVDEYRLGRLVWELALQGSCEVLYLSVVHTPGEELEVSRRLSKLASVTKDPRLQVRTHIQFGSSWPEIVRRVSMPGDRILCLEDQVVRRWGVWKRPLARWVTDVLKAPVYVLGREFH